MFGWLIHHMKGANDLGDGLRRGLEALVDLTPETRMTLNFIVTDGECLAASRLGYRADAPTLYTLADHPRFPQAVLVASEPLFEHNAWESCPQGSIVTVDGDRSIRVEPFRV